MTVRKKIVFLFLFAGCLCWSTAAPIRVGIFKGVGTGSSYWHPSIHPGSDAIAAMLADPAQAGLQNPVIPARGFSVTMYGVDTSCAQNGCVPSALQRATFIAALDSLDVVIFPNNVAIGDAIPDPLHRQRLASFWLTRGVISLHWSTDSKATWAPWDSLHGTQFQTREDYVEGTVHLDTAGFADILPSWKLLNRGLPDTARFREEWINFTTSGAAIRSQTSLIPTVNLDDNSYVPRLSNVPKGDHPFSWYREFPEGGRFFYTGMGHQTSTYQSEYYFRRQLYNAVLWAAGADSNGIVVSARPAGRAGAAASLKTWGSGSRIHVRVAEAGALVELFSPDGTRLASQRARSPGIVSLQKPQHGGTFIVRVRSTQGIRSAWVMP
jgi:hypothetical protein